MSGFTDGGVMFTIGDFARHGRVSVRMLRHYDALGLLQPAAVDQATGYRYYEGRQLDQLNRIVALKELGFSLRQVGDILRDEVDVAELRGMLTLRRAELADQVASGTVRLAQVEARLRLLEEDGSMPIKEVHVKSIPAVRVAELTARAAGFDPQAISPVVRPLFADLGKRVGAAGLRVTAPAIAYYEGEDDGDGVVVHAALPVATEAKDGFDFDVVDLPTIDRAATVVHEGSMDEVMPTVQALVSWIEGNGYTSVGAFRELYLESDPDHCEAWVTELQEGIA